MTKHKKDWVCGLNYCNHPQCHTLPRSTDTPSVGGMDFTPQESRSTGTGKWEKEFSKFIKQYKHLPIMQIEVEQIYDFFMSHTLPRSTGTGKWEEEFDEAVRKQANEGNPYWPDWDAVKAFISTHFIPRSEVERKCEEMEKSLEKLENNGYRTGYKAALQDLKNSLLT